MYDELIKRLHQRIALTHAGSPLQDDLREAAEAIEKLQQIAGHYEETAKDYFKDVCYYLERVPKWIPVTEQLPDFEGCLLCMRKAFVGDKLRYQDILYYEEGTFYMEFEDTPIPTECITHWMPLPEPPKEET